jgi:hypothetical protein
MALAPGTFMRTYLALSFVLAFMGCGGDTTMGPGDMSSSSGPDLSPGGDMAVAPGMFGALCIPAMNGTDCNNKTCTYMNGGMTVTNNCCVSFVMMTMPRCTQPCTNTTGQPMNDPSHCPPPSTGVCTPKGYCQLVQ